MTSPQPYVNPYGWILPATDALFDPPWPYEPLLSPEENLAERLVILGHRAFNSDVWARNTSRLARYWDAYDERIQAALATDKVVTYWCTLHDQMSLAPLHKGLLDDKNRIVRPRLLPGTTVDDEAVLDVLRAHHLDLRDRTRYWVALRREERAALYGTGDETEIPDGDDA